MGARCWLSAGEECPTSKTSRVERILLKSIRYPQLKVGCLTSDIRKKRDEERVIFLVPKAEKICFGSLKQSKVA